MLLSVIITASFSIESVAKSLISSNLCKFKTFIFSYPFWIQLTAIFIKNPQAKFMYFITFFTKTSLILPKLFMQWDICEKSFIPLSIKKFALKVFNNKIMFWTTFTFYDSVDAFSQNEPLHNPYYLKLLILIC